MKPFVTPSSAATKALAKKVAAGLSANSILCLYGELGSGKTTFTQGLGEYFGIKRLISPTYLLLRQYPTNHPVIKTLNHLDLYHLSSYRQLRAIDLDEIWSDPQAVTVIEWPDRLADHLPIPRYDIHFEFLSENSRKITINQIK